MKGTATNVDNPAKPSLKDSEIRYRRLFEAAQDGILILDAKTGAITDVNPFLINLLGYSRAEFVRKKLWEVGAFRDVEASKEAFEALQQDKYIRYKDLPLRSKDGRLIPVEFVSSAYLADGQKVIQCHIRDITERKHAEEVQLETGESYRSALEAMTEGFQIIGKDWRYLFVNDSVAAQGKRKKEELVGKTMMECYPGIEQTEMFAALQRCMDERCSYTMLNEFLFPDSSRGWFELRLQPVPSGILILSNDITERKRAEEASLLQSTALNAAANSIMITNRDGAIEWVNQAFSLMTGYTAEEVLGKNPRELVNSGSQDNEFYGKLWGTILAGEVWRSEVINRRKNGDFYAEQETITPVRNAGGEIRHFIAIKDDITERKRAEAAIAQMAAIVEASDDAIIGQTLEGLITSWNRGAQKLYGYSAEEAIGQNISFIVPRDRIEELREVLSQLHRGEKVARLETVRRRKDGIQLDVALTVSLIPDAAGRAAIAASISRDITESKRAQEEIRQLNADLEQRVAERTAELSQANMLLETLLDTTPDQIYFKDSESRYIRNSKAQAHELGVNNPAVLAGKSDFDFFSHAQSSHAAELEIMRSGTPQLDIEEWVVWPDGHGTWISTTKAPLRDQADKIVGTFGISRDITSRKRNQEALKRANEELEAFSYSVSHDLRAPLRAIDGFSRILLEDYRAALPAEASRFLGLVRSETQKMGVLVDDLLAFSRLSRQALNLQTVEPAELVRQVLEDLHAERDGRQIEIGIEDLPACAADPALLKQVFVNLLANALKFTRRRPVAHIEVGSEQKDGTSIYFVRDDGVGFDMKYVGKLFGVFQRLHLAEEYEGTGVGLAIVQRIVNRHGGRVWAEGAIDKGATFYFTLNGGLSNA